VWLVLLGFSGLSAFVLWESRVQHPVFEIDLFRKNTLFAYSSLAAFVNYCATFSVSFLLSLYLQYTKGLDPQHAGVILVAQPVVMTVFSPLAGRLSDSIEPRIVASIGMALTVLALLLFALLDEQSSIAFILTGLVVIGLGLALFSSPNANAIMSSVERKYYGIASASVGTMRLTGQMLSMGIVMILFAVYLGRSRITPEQYPLFLKSARIAFLIFAVFCFFGVFASLARGRVRAERTS
jgi:MFS family permease